ncbi:hypothetical protein [uncultured Croceitalea sp.]|uniref:hypothetical protein n=1 Tax=uncultured Croceitalea sp. TaxID=1798908 RepID=UPI003305BDD5
MQTTMESNWKDNKTALFFAKGMLCLAVLGITSGCQKKFSSEKELWTYIKNPENGYHLEKTMGHIKYALTYRPTDVLVKQSLTDDFDQMAIDSLRQIYGDYLYFNLSMSANDQELLNSKAADRAAFGTMVNQLAFGMDNKVHLITKSRDTIPLADYIYPRMYGMANSTNLLLVYPKDKAALNEDYFHFTIEDLGFATGEVGFKVPTKPIVQEPQLTFDQTL